MVAAILDFFGEAGNIRFDQSNLLQRYESLDASVSRLSL
jgi:hypothetical protein